jgi:hypothetical protein
MNFGGISSAGYSIPTATVGRVIGVESCEESKQGGLAQLARAPALQAGGHRFESDILHHRPAEAFGEEARELTIED